MTAKAFVLIEREEIAPFRWLQSTDRADIGFLVIDPSLVVDGLQDCDPQPGMGVFRTREPGSGSRPCDVHGRIRKRPKHRKSPGSHSSSTTKEEQANRLSSRKQVSLPDIPCYSCLKATPCCRPKSLI